MSEPSALFGAFQDEVEIGIDSLLRAREQDPYLDPPTRLLYERVKGEPAPTFPAPVLDAAVLRTRLAKEGKRRRERKRASASASSGELEEPAVQADERRVAASTPTRAGAE